MNRIPQLPTKWQKQTFTTQDLIKEAPDQEAFKKHIQYLIDHDGEFCIGLDFNNLGFMQDYYHLSKIIPYDSVIVDVGCSIGLQHVLFKDYKKYIGIDIHNTHQKAFTPNAEFIINEFTQALEMLDQYDPKELFGIANMSLAYWPGKDNEILNAFKAKFGKMFIR